ncbi:MAG: hypothetical protein LBU65_09800 [Planctomycetaceae bacterium]|jgi:hypothetical protein|nr:hypothetical protein [Planctomycetaceae bacterium]
MSQFTSLQRKIIYIVVIVLLFYPLYRLGYPSKSVVDATGNVIGIDPGGLLSRERANMELADAQIGQIDPSSTTMKLATFGMRGVAISLLWYRSNEFEKREDWNNVIATGNQIVLLEPNFVKMWEFLGWKYAYNASASFDDYRERYRWVIRGFNFITRGLRYNQKVPKLFKNAGWTISQKIGIADENVQYRRLLRDDEEFGKLYNCEHPSDRDNWLLGRRWYHIGEGLVEEGRGIDKESEFLFFSHSRLNLFNYAMWVRKDGIFGAPAMAAWRDAQEAWNEFSMKDLGTAIDDNKGGKPYRSTLHKLEEINAAKDEMTKQLQGIVPDLYKSLCIKRWDLLSENWQQASLLDRLTAEKPEPIYVVIREHLDATEPGWRERLKKEQENLFTKEQLELKKIPFLLLEESQSAIISKGNEEFSVVSGRANNLLEVSQKVLSDEIQELRDVTSAQKANARRIIQDMEAFAIDTRMSRLFREILNYEYRVREAVVEQTNEVDDARRFQFEGRAAYYDNRRQESNRLWLQSMNKWRELLDKPEFADIWDQGTFVSQILELVEKYVIILDADNELFPPEFGLQKLVLYDISRDGRIKQTMEAQDYAKKTFGSGDFDTADKYFQKILGSWGGVNATKEYMKLAPVPEVRDSILEALAYYVRIQRKLNREVTDETPLIGFARDMLRNDPLIDEAAEAYRSAETQTSEQKADDAEKTLATAIETWKRLIQKYPMIVLQPQQSVHNDLLLATTLYTQVVKSLNKDVPEELKWVEDLGKKPIPESLLEL